uniref:Uncharacterized protein n=1 Tax=Arundo donax TaxID=35708 RepID=A0A0A9HLI2_ARUDO
MPKRQSLTRGPNGYLIQGD